MILTSCLLILPVKVGRPQQDDSRQRSHKLHSSGLRSSFFQAKSRDKDFHFCSLQDSSQYQQQRELQDCLTLCSKVISLLLMCLELNFHLTNSQRLRLFRE